MKPDDEPELTARQALLTEVLLGVRDRNDPDVAAASADPSFVAMLDGLLAVQQRLDRAASAERAATTEPGLPRDARLAELVRQRLRSRWPRWAVGLSLCAAALVVAGVLLLSRNGAQPPGYERLDGAGAVVCEPDYAAIRWAEVPGASRYQVRILRPGVDGTFTEVEQSPTLDSNRWQPTQRATYGPWMRIEVIVPGAEEDRVVQRADFWRSGQPR